MARKKKEKIIVKLDLPKDDTTLTKLLRIVSRSGQLENLHILTPCGLWDAIIKIKQPEKS